MTLVSLGATPGEAHEDDHRIELRIAADTGVVVHAQGEIRRVIERPLNLRGLDVRLDPFGDGTISASAYALERGEILPPELPFFPLIEHQGAPRHQLAIVGHDA